MHEKYPSEILNERHSQCWNFNPKMDLKEHDVNFNCVYRMRLGKDRVQWRTRMKLLMTL
jgi:hypothetical protein